MNITVTRSGGLGGLIRRASVDTGGRGDAAAWQELVRRARLDAAPAYRPAPDRYVYDIEVDGRSYRVGEADLGGPMAELVDRVLAEGGRS
ncbi:MAG: hypothetical protein GEV11_29410 [Streptosporangiales bacterium]|nr:hypothetical protein [Streptosporangiales bacterium]